jgi:hypothetical protein
VPPERFAACRDPGTDRVAAQTVLDIRPGWFGSITGYRRSCSSRSGVHAGGARPGEGGFTVAAVPEADVLSSDLSGPGHAGEGVMPDLQASMPADSAARCSRRKSCSGYSPLSVPGWRSQFRSDLRSSRPLQVSRASRFSRESLRSLSGSSRTPVRFSRRSILSPS